jgi:hypothetical protein
MFHAIYVPSAAEPAVGLKPHPPRAPPFCEERRKTKVRKGKKEQEKHLIFAFLPYLKIYIFALHR